MAFTDVDQLESALAGESYLADRGLAVSVYLALTLRRPLLLEGEPGVGKTEIARTLARVTGAELIRLQCYEGIDAAQALYEWDYARQLLYARTLQDGRLDPSRRAAELYGPEFLVERPLLRAVRAGAGAVLLIDEIDRADEEFEAFLLEVLADAAVTIPEIGTITAEAPPVVVLTSNRTRELHDALKRRCLYHWIDYPDLERETAIIRLRAPEASEALARSVATVVARLRELDLVEAARPRRGDRLDACARRDRHRPHRRRLGGRDPRRRREEPRRHGPRAEDPPRGDLVDDPGKGDLGPALALARGLRDAGVPVGTGRVISMARGAQAVGPEDLYWAARATLISRREDLPAFDRAFEAAFGIETRRPADLAGGRRPPLHDRRRPASSPWRPATRTTRPRRTSRAAWTPCAPRASPSAPRPSWRSWRG